MLLRLNDDETVLDGDENISVFLFFLLQLFIGRSSVVNKRSFSVRALKPD